MIHFVGLVVLAHGQGSVIPPPAYIVAQVVAVALVVTVVVSQVVRMMWEAFTAVFRTVLFACWLVLVGSSVATAAAAVLYAARLHS